VGARVILVDGLPAAWIGPDEKQLLTFPDLPAEDRRDLIAESIAQLLATEVDTLKRRAFLLASVDDTLPASEPLHSALVRAGFVLRDDGYQKRLH
jgi:hypothetical protein